MHFAYGSVCITSGIPFKQKTFSATIHRAVDIHVIAVRSQDNNSQCWQRMEKLARSLKAVKPRHRDVHQYHIRHQLCGEGNGFTTILRFTHHFYI